MKGKGRRPGRILERRPPQLAISGFREHQLTAMLIVTRGARRHCDLEHV